MPSLLYLPNRALWVGACVMGWMQDRDLLIAEGLAFVKAVKGADAELPEPLQIVPIVQTEQSLRSEPPSDFNPPKFDRVVSLPPKNEREEIASRLASFKATQLKFQREREQYGSTTLKDALNGTGAPRPPNARSNRD